MLFSACVNGFGGTRGDLSSLRADVVSLCERGCCLVSSPSKARSMYAVRPTPVVNLLGLHYLRT